MTFGDDGARNCMCDPYVQVNAYKAEIFTQVRGCARDRSVSVFDAVFFQVVLDIPGKQVCNSVQWWCVTQ